MISYLLLLLLILSLFNLKPVDNLIIFLLWIFLLAIQLYNNEFYFLTWIILIIYGSALVILFTYVLMIKFNYKLYNDFFKLKLFKFSPIIFIISLFLITPISYIDNIYNTSKIYDSMSLMNYILNIEPIYIILLFIQLLYAFIILITPSLK